MSSAYLWLLIFHPAIWNPACDSSSLAFHMMYSAYKLKKQGDDIQPYHTPFNFEPVTFSMSSYNCCFLTCIQISQEAGEVVWYSHFFKNFPVYCDPHSTSKGLSNTHGFASLFLSALSTETLCYSCPHPLAHYHIQCSINNVK